MKSVAWGNVISATARRNLEYDLNPDVEEVLEMNRMTRRRECKHLRRSWRQDDYSGWLSYFCADCGTSLKPLPGERT